jgi:hypothetical protein
MAATPDGQQLISSPGRMLNNQRRIFFLFKQLSAQIQQSSPPREPLSSCAPGKNAARVQAHAGRVVRCAKTERKGTLGKLYHVVAIRYQYIFFYSQSATRLKIKKYIDIIASQHGDNEKGAFFSVEGKAGGGWGGGAFNMPVCQLV